MGGQVDFIYGASRSEGGKAILAMPSVTNKGISKIAPELTLGAGCGDYAFACALVCNRIRCRKFIWQIVAGAGLG